MTKLIACALATLLTSAPVLAATAPTARRIEQVPAGTEWIAGHGRGVSRAALPVRAVKVPFDVDALWQERLDGPGLQFRRLWGRGVAVEPAAMQDAEVAAAVAEGFWREHATLLPDGVRPGDLAPWSNTLTADGTRLVSHHQLLDGVPVLGASTFVAIKAGRLVMVGVHGFAAQPFDGQARIAASQAERRAVAALRELGIDASAGHAELVVVPLHPETTPSFALAYQVELRAPGQGRWTAYIDARKDALIALRDERLFAAGTLELDVHSRHPASAVVASPASRLQLSAGGASSYSDASGQFSVAGDNVDVSVTPRGRYVQVNNLSGPALGHTFTGVVEGETLAWQSDGSELQQAQLDAYANATRVRDYARGFIDDVSWLDGMLQVHVNHSEVCNAWFDGDLTFLRAGEEQGFRCNNSAMVADIVYHEFGHGLHYASVVGGVGSMDDAVSEGFADFMAALLTGDHAMAPYFAVSGEPLRDLEPDRRWPEDEGYDPHDTGLIVGGALWDLRKALIASRGEADGVAAAKLIFASVLKTTSSVPSLYEATLLADDDNGDLSDGTPNICGIDAAYAAHGLSSQRFGVLRIDHEQRAYVDADQPIQLDARVRVSNPECADAAVGAVQLFYSVGEAGAWTAVPMTRSGDDAYQAEIPAQPAGTQLRYRLEATDPVSGQTVTRPGNRAEQYYLLYVGELAAISCDDFEGEEQGWSHSLVAGQQAEGADDWQRSTPGGLGGDPDHAYSGDNVWGTDLALESNWNGQYQSNKRTALISPRFDLSAYSQVRLQFRRWLQVEDGRYDRARIYVNDQEVWANAAGDGEQHHLDQEWVLFDVDISAPAGGQSDVRIRWEIESDRGMEFGGWNIDDVCLYEVVSARVGSGGDVEGPAVLRPGDNTPGEDIAHLAGCDCRTTGDVGAATLLPLLLGLLALRRRRG